MKANYTNSKTELKKSIPANFEGAEYRAITDSTVVGSKVYGIICSKSKKFVGHYNYALACSDKTSCFWLNIPEWLGKGILADFNDSGLECSDYFTGNTIKAVNEIPTSKGNPTYSLEFAE